MIRGRSLPRTSLSARRCSVGGGGGGGGGRSVSWGWYWMRRAHSETGGGGAMTMDAEAADTACERLWWPKPDGSMACLALWLAVQGPHR